MNFLHQDKVHNVMPMMIRNKPMRISSFGHNEDRIFSDDEIESFQSNDCFINGVDNPHRIPLEMKNDHGHRFLLLKIMQN
ncbi:hypothetical protein DERP_002594 [Dermatophagoides pteronyssinus]|uniref:Uncharacterized protein n=1 Tax=Dermatophagoides pteronyssinus TaxID=6956 RepID=A0ABQ8JIJ0_DERPT|nr:hypothetical protein DERP_002594 [Dermatophagoides pteronyssinus]